MLVFQSMPEATRKSLKNWGRTRLYALAVAAFVVVAVVAMIMNPSLPELAKSVRIGDSKGQVEKILGKPVEVLKPSAQTVTNFVAALLFAHHETWVYGKSVELTHSSNFPYVRLDLKFRFFRPESNDVAIEFDNDERVSEVTIPDSARQP